MIEKKVSKKTHTQTKKIQPRIENQMDTNKEETIK